MFYLLTSIILQVSEGARPRLENKYLVLVKVQQDPQELGKDIVYEINLALNMNTHDKHSLSSSLIMLNNVPSGPAAVVIAPARTKKNMHTM